jgi:hypothetical protein
MSYLDDRYVTAGVDPNNSSRPAIPTSARSADLALETTFRLKHQRGWETKVAHSAAYLQGHGHHIVLRRPPIRDVLAWHLVAQKDAFPLSLSLDPREVPFPTPLRLHRRRPLI